MILVSLFAALTAVGAFITIPFQPVPFSLQTLFTLLAGMVLGSVAGPASQIIYIFLGIIGLPVFAGFKSGIGILIGPTGGFIFGFVISVYAIGRITEKKETINIFRYLLAGSLGTVLIYFFGIIQLSMITGIGMKNALFVGALPFLPGDILKIAAASFIAHKLNMTSFGQK